MADAVALFKRHWADFMRATSHYPTDPTNQMHIASTLYAACIIAEAVRNGMEDTDLDARQ